MKILLCASKTPDTTSKIAFTDDKKQLNNTGITFILNPYDDHGLGKAVDLKEQTGASLTVIHVGDASSKAILDRCLAIGADDCIRIDMEPTNAMEVAQQIYEVIKDDQYDLIITGRESIDFNGGQVCDLLAEMLSIPSIPFVTALTLEGQTANISRFIEGGEEKLTVQLPLVISATKDLAEWKIPNMRGIMSARTKPTKVVAPAAIESTVNLIAFENPVAKSGVKLIEADHAEELVKILHETEKLF
jgi:electron transfer flavoprotein beta subunit